MVLRDVNLKTVLFTCDVLTTRQKVGFPTATGGRGADTALMTSWLEDFMQRIDARLETYSFSFIYIIYNTYIYIFIYL